MYQQIQISESQGNNSLQHTMSSSFHNLSSQKGKKRPVGEAKPGGFGPPHALSCLEDGAGG